MKEGTSQGSYIKKDSKIIWRILCEWIDCLDKLNKFFEMLTELTEEKNQIGLYLLQNLQLKYFPQSKIQVQMALLGKSSKHLRRKY